jgi:ribose 5-phosphate isomerase A
MAGESRHNLTIAECAIDFVKDGMIVGLGSGSAAAMFVDVLGRQVQSGKLHIAGVPTSEVTAAQARRLGIELRSLDDVLKLGDRPIDVAVDGADEVDSRLNLIKGYGRAAVREKIVESAAKQFVVVVGKNKLVEQLGQKGKLPVEVVPFGVALAERRLRSLGCEPVLWMKDGNVGTTDNGNYILDCKVAPIDDPEKLEYDIRAIPGVVGTGLFLGMADVVLVGDPDAGFRFVEERRR